MSRTARALLLIALVVGVGAAACTAPKPDREYERQRNLKNEITMLEDNIITWRKEAGLAYRPAPFWFAQKRNPFRTPMPQAAKCERCGEVCDLTDYICGAAEQICRIAGELPGDTWAANKCKTAKASCGEAKQNCQKCRCTASDTVTESN